MGPFKTLRVDIDSRGVASLTLNRPERKNAISGTMMDELVAFTEAIATSQNVKVVVMSGADGTFCAGADLTWMMAQIEADRKARMAEAKRFAMMLKALNELPLPLIGKLENVALGGGMGLACICDVAVATKDCRFGFTETRLGIIPATISPYVLARMGEGKARRVLMSARIFQGDEAQSLDVVAQAVDPEDLNAAIEAELAPYLALPRGAVGRAKRLTRSLGITINEAVIDDKIRQLADAWETEEAREGISAFLEKRKPAWG
ncbi:MAG: crotonase/enoyl-CoA hydratase family protein [Pseudomonadota bacterium]